MERTAQEKLNSLLNFQNIDSRLDELRRLRGDLPEEIRDLEDEIEGYNTRKSKLDNDLADLEQGISDSRQGIKDAEKLIVKYQEQQNNVRNNREYDAITKEIELQHLEIQILDKRIKESGANIEAKKEILEITTSALKERSEDLEVKRKELNLLIAESEEEEKKLLAERAKAEKQIEERLLYSYNRLRQNLRNGLAVVKVERGACGGCFNVVPPQRQAEIREQKKIIVCEHCGRILADVQEETAEDEKRSKVRVAADA